VIDCFLLEIGWMSSIPPLIVVIVVLILLIKWIRVFGKWGIYIYMHVTVTVWGWLNGKVLIIVVVTYRQFECKNWKSGTLESREVKHDVPCFQFCSDFNGLKSASVGPNGPDRFGLKGTQITLPAFAFRILYLLLAPPCF